MKNLRLIIWLTQLGISVALPPTALILLAVWLRNRFAWGNWVIFLGIAIGIFCAVDGLRKSLKAMEQMSKDGSETQPPVAFNDHD